jgi:hypothetical protein
MEGSAAMYLFDYMIDYGLPAGQDWPSPAHRQVAVNALPGNPLIDSMDKLQLAVRAVCAVPADRIKAVTMRNLVEEFGAPALWDKNR